MKYEVITDRFEVEKLAEDIYLSGENHLYILIMQIFALSEESVH